MRPVKTPDPSHYRRKELLTRKAMQQRLAAIFALIAFGILVLWG